MIGFINVYKPSGITSHDVVAQVRRLLGTKHVGHGGTLDPIAEGVLPIGVGPACRLFRFLPDRKQYRAHFLLGRTTTTDDIEGEKIAETNHIPDKEEILSELKTFVGDIQQVPPSVSAIKQHGERLYNLARRGQAVLAPPRPVSVYNIDVLSVNFPTVEVRVFCSAGTYIRSLARDLGTRLKTGGCLSALLREKAGIFSLDNSVKLSELSGDNKLQDSIVSPLEVFQDSDIPCLQVDTTLATKVKFGQKFPLPESISVDSVASKYLAMINENKLIAVYARHEDGLLHPEVVIQDAS